MYRVFRPHTISLVMGTGTYDDVMRILLLSAGLGLSLLLLALSVPGMGSGVIPSTQLAQIIAVNTGVLKLWSSAGSLEENLAYASTGSEVRLLQKMLSQDSELYPSQEVTGYYGDMTQEGVRKFQIEHGIEGTGSVDDETREKLNAIFLSHLCPSSTDEEEEEDLLLVRVTKEQSLPETYVPPFLTEISSRVRTAGVVCLRSDVVRPLTRMFRRAEADGVQLMVTSGYRKPEIQGYLYTLWSSVLGEQAKKEVARPGYSEHQLGSALDLSDQSIGFALVDPRFAESAGGIWLSEHAYEYGFVLSYPEGQEEETGYVYEPWHYRYVGKDIAQALQEKKVSYNEVEDSFFKKGRKIRAVSNLPEPVP